MRAKLGYGVPLVVFGLLLGASSLPWADVPPPTTGGCFNHKAGDACLDDQMQSGVCTDDKCTVLDKVDGGTMIVDCLVCKAGASSSSSSASGSGGGSSSSSGGSGCAMMG